MSDQNKRYLNWIVRTLVPGVNFTGLGTLILTAIGITAVNLLVSYLLTIDDESPYYRHALLRQAKRYRGGESLAKYPGVIFVEIDGLSEPELRRAIGDGHMPTLARWLESGSHHLTPWETDASCQTGACQAGILHGNNSDMPAFRWVDKSQDNRLVSSGSPTDVPEIEAHISDGNGLLQDQFIPAEEAQVIVLASGNLGLVTFADWPDRMSYEQINNAFPDLIPGLVNHEGIGFILVNSEENAGLVIGRDDTYFLGDDRIEGENPLADFRPRAAQHLRRTNSFHNAPDLLVNSFYDPELDEGAAFEEQISFHGGLGGAQAWGFLLYPSEWSLVHEEIVGAEQVTRCSSDN